MNTDDPFRNRVKKKIFLIDDNADVLTVIKISLEMLDYEVFEFARGGDAIEKFPVIQPDLVIVDQGLPDIDGIEVGRQIRELESGGRCPLVLLTGSDGQALRELARKFGFDDFLVKPVRINMLAQGIERQLDRQE